MRSGSGSKIQPITSRRTARPSKSDRYDTNEINWELKQWGVEKFEKGWNWVVLKGADGNISGGDPNYDALMRFRIYVNGIQQSTMKIDRITIGSGEKLLTAPDWESEKYGSDPGHGFQGPNAYDSTNDIFFDEDLEDGAKDFTATVTETVKKKVTQIVQKTVYGCSGSVAPVPAILALAGIAVVIALVAALKKKSGRK